MDPAEARARLLALRDEVQAGGDSETAAEARQPVELDQQSVGRLSRMDAIQGQAMAQAAEARRQLQLRRIDAALQRVEAGDYGFCTTCGDEIAPKRLELDPAIVVCIACAPP